MNPVAPLAIDNAEFLAGGGEMGAKLRALDWSATPLGAAQNWPQSLRSALSICLGSSFQIALYWGQELCLLYNDAWSPILGTKHPDALGKPGHEVWPEIWETIGPMFARVFSTGEATRSQDELLAMHRHGFTEECYFDYTFSPIRDEAGKVGGIFNAVVETTFRIIGERRTRLLRDLGERLSTTLDPRAVCEAAVATLGAGRIDLPFVLIYLVDPESSSETLALGGAIGMGTGDAGAPAELAPSGPWPTQQALNTGSIILVSDLTERLQTRISSGAWPEACDSALVVPLIAAASNESLGLLIVGLSPRLKYDAEYRTFAERIAVSLCGALSRGRALEHVRRRAEALAEIDRAKTAFFSNVSHEFRTPLALLLGPLEEALQNPAEGLKGEALDSVHRNALRLLRLVNTLLDFSRIEAGRDLANFVPTDLSAVTGELASVFRSAVERAGLRYSVSCNALAESVFIDREMWEKIVLNLLSNAFKYTFEGEIRVEMRSGGQEAGAELVVTDTGTGIPADALPQLFNRFYRVPGANGRTHEGSGIGLSLVRELVKLHGGSIDVESVVGQGSSFRVRIPFGNAHLPSASVAQEERAVTTGGAQPFVEEARRWLPDVPNVGQSETVLALEAFESSSMVAMTAMNKPTVLLVDDNRDMREYVSRLLQARFTVIPAQDGQHALDLLDTGMKPDLVLSDVMMPRLDGFGLLKVLRSRPVTETTPVIFLSARAGEEARIEGFDVGADDYLIKPFSARELITRIDTHIRLSRLRRAASEQVKVSEERLRIAIDEAGMGTWDLDLRTNEGRWSRSHYELLGYQPPADSSQVATYEMWINRTHPEDREAVEAALEHARNTQSLYSQEYRIIRADTGSVRWLRALGRFLYDDSGAPVRSVGVDFDDTDRKAAELALREADQRKDVFLATLAHELRNPLAPIRNAAQMLGSPKLDSEQLQWAQSVIQRQVKHMALLLDDLLDVARITQGKLDLKKQLITLNAVVDSAVEAVRPLIDSKRHQFTVTLPAEAVTLDADPLRLSQVISNLLTNAAKYTDAGGHITFSGHIENDRLTLSIKDNGIGIPADSLEGVFIMFSQVEGAAARSEGGLGIGLALVHGLAELHGGTVRAKSGGLGQGSEFIVNLPIVTCEPAATPEVDAAACASVGRRILVADDNQDAADSLAMLLEMAGHDVRVVHDGRAALSAAQTFRPDTMLLDIGMPQLNGYEVAHALRQESWGAEITLIALTGWGKESDRHRALQAGFDRHLTKPVDPDELEKLLAGNAEGRV